MDRLYAGIHNLLFPLGRPVQKSSFLHRVLPLLIDMGREQISDSF